MAPYTFAVEDTLIGKQKHITLKGVDETAVLHAVYTFLEKAGWMFEISGPVLTSEIPLIDKKNYYEEKLDPVVRQRGIRQHINFPMDISSYYLPDAREYIRNLARMRFNSITFHSYPGQWYEVAMPDTTEYAGHFFYGDLHSIPDLPFVKDHVNNKRVFCIPEIEPYFNDTPMRSRMAIHWLQQVMEYAKRCGFYVQFSIEPRDPGTNLSHSKQVVQSVLKDYPMIDALELMTQETGGWGPKCTRKEVVNTILKHYGKEALKEEEVTAAIMDKQTDLAELLGEMGHNIALIKELKKEESDVPELKLGIYSAINIYTKAVHRLARMYAPDIELSLLSGHHSRRVAENTPQMLENSKEWDNTRIYSWIEFDGMMYLQQNGIEGIHRIIGSAQENSTNGKVNALLFNHWRTAENHITARYAALASLYGDISPDIFYKDYALSLGIAQPETFARAMQMLDDEEWKATTSFGNMGFCWLGMWSYGGAIGYWKAEDINREMEVYQKIAGLIKESYEKTISEQGKYVLSFLDNRILCTILYMKAFRKATELNQFKKDQNDQLSESDKKAYADICNQVLLIFDQYMELHTQMMPDRGTEGTLVSVYNGPVFGVKVLRKKYAGIPFDEEALTTQPVDAPPLPIYQE